MQGCDFERFNMADIRLETASTVSKTGFSGDLPTGRKLSSEGKSLSVLYDFTGVSLSAKVIGRFFPAKFFPVWWVM